ncbi:hypothetical protein [Aquisphaera insulae]|uniref:hypothetical protein n=1 Tax=Aquisphaera insulae TaxID=2712864 RepID=UPI00202E5ABE|nr:hypothetical protein [Aquisphaera insulae]
MVLSVACLLAVSVMAIAPARAQVPEHQDVVLRGKVLPLATALRQARADLRFDAGPVEKQVALVGNDGELLPLLSDEASRALFLDERLRDRPVEIKGRRLRGLPYLQVVSFKVEEGGRLRTPEYYCIICSIRVRFPQTCPCCQGEMELRMKPEKD